MKIASTQSQILPRVHPRATPWGVRVLLGVSILFGIWVDVSSIGATAPDTSSNSPTSSTQGADRNQTHLVGLNDQNSTVGAIVKTLASRRS